LGEIRAVSPVQADMANLYERLIIQGIAQRSGALVDTLYASVVHKLGLHDRFFREVSRGVKDVAEL
jgi:hypothetical protein